MMMMMWANHALKRLAIVQNGFIGSIKSRLGN